MPHCGRCCPGWAWSVSPCREYSGFVGGCVQIDSQTLLPLLSLWMDKVLLLLLLFAFRNLCVDRARDDFGYQNATVHYSYCTPYNVRPISFFQ